MADVIVPVALFVLIGFLVSVLRDIIEAACRIPGTQYLIRGELRGIGNYGASLLNALNSEASIAAVRTPEGFPRNLTQRAARSGEAGGPRQQRRGSARPRERGESAAWPSRTVP